MHKRIFWIFLGALLCFSCITMMSSKSISYGETTPGIACSSDGKYVYIIASKSDSYYRSEDYGRTFENFDIAPSMDE